MSLNIKSLEAAANAATPGRWVRGKFGGVYPDNGQVRGPCIVHARYADHTNRPNAEADEAFVAAFNPEVVLGLINRLRDAEQSSDEDVIQSFLVDYNTHPTPGEFKDVNGYFDWWKAKRRHERKLAEGAEQ